MAGVIVEVKRDGVMAQVDMACGPFRIVSLMSREAADELGLEPGADGDGRREVADGDHRTRLSNPAAVARSKQRATAATGLG